MEKFVDQTSNKKKRTRSTYGVKRINKGCLDKILSSKDGNREVGNILGWVIISGYIEGFSSNGFMLNDTTGTIEVNYINQDMGTTSQNIRPKEWVTLYGYFTDSLSFKVKKIQYIEDINEFIYHMVVSLNEFYNLGEGIDIKELVSNGTDESITPEMSTLLDVIKSKAFENPSVSIKELIPEMKKKYPGKTESTIAEELDRTIKSLEMTGLIYYEDVKKTHIAITLK